MELILGNILLSDETYIADLTKYPNYQYKVIMGHVDYAVSSSVTPKNEKRKSITPITTNLKKKRDPLVKFILNMYNDVEIEYPGFDMKIDIALKGMRFTFLNRFVDEMLKWLMNSALLK